MLLSPLKISRVSFLTKSPNNTQRNKLADLLQSFLHCACQLMSPPLKFVALPSITPKIYFLSVYPQNIKE